MRRLALAPLFELLVTAAAGGQSSTAFDSIDRYMAAELRRDRIPGVSVAVLRGDSVVLARGYGYANIELRVPTSDSTVYQSGSVGKQFTAAAVVMLAEQGRLSLDDPITRYLPEGPAGWGRITIRHLLTHTSGIGDYTDSTLDVRRDYTEDDMVRLATRQALEFAPGDRWELQQHRLRPAGRHYPPRQRGVLRRFSAGTRLPPARHAHDAHHLRGGHHSESGGRVSPRGRHAQESGMGVAVAQHHRGRRALLHGPRPRALGHRPESLEGSESRGARNDLDARPSQHGRHLPVRLRLADHPATRPAAHRAQRRLAGLRDDDSALSRLRPDRDRARQPRGVDSRNDGDEHRRDVRAAARPAASHGAVVIRSEGTSSDRPAARRHRERSGHGPTGARARGLSHSRPTCTYRAGAQARRQLDVRRL